MSGKRIRARRTIVIETEYPFDNRYYPDMSLRDAIMFEKRLPLSDVLTDFDPEVEDPSKFETIVTLVSDDDIDQSV